MGDTRATIGRHPCASFILTEKVQKKNQNRTYHIFYIFWSVSAHDLKSPQNFSFSLCPTHGLAERWLTLHMKMIDFTSRKRPVHVMCTCAVIAQLLRVTWRDVLVLVWIIAPRKLQLFFGDGGSNMKVFLSSSTGAASSEKLSQDCCRICSFSGWGVK